MDQLDTYEELRKENELLKQRLEEKDRIIEEKENRIKLLERVIIDFKREKFGSKSEKLDPNDHLYGSLFNEAELGLKDPESLYDGHSETEHVSGYSRRKRGRKPIPDYIPRETIIHDISESEKICSCGCELKEIGEEVSEQLSIIPAKVVVHRHVRKKYAVQNAEDQIRNKDFHKQEKYDEIMKIRTECSKPILDSLHQYIKEISLRFPPRSSMEKAIQYSLEQWPKMELYITHGECYIDNNLVENAIRPFVLGRKNWLFSGCPEGAEASAFWYPLIQTIKANHKDPYSAMVSILKKLPECQTSEECKNIFFETMGWNN